MLNEINKLLSSQYLKSIYTITTLRLKSQYQGSYLGIFWSMINPMAYVVILSLVFSTIMRFPVDNYVLYMAPGVISWNYLVNSIMAASNSLIKSQNIIKRAVISKTIFPTSDVALNTYLFVLSYIAIVIIIKAIVVRDLSFSVLYFPIVAIPLVLTVASTSVGLAYITPYFWDTPHLLSVLFNILFWTVPLAYPIEVIPESKRIFFEYHPVYLITKPIIDITYYNVFPSFKTLFYAILVALLSTTIAYLIYKKLRKRVVYYI